MDFKFPILLFFTMIQISCASLSDKSFEKLSVTNRSKALVYVYRPSHFAGSAGSPYVCIDDQVVGEVLNGGYFPVTVKPGRHSVSLKALSETLTELDFKVVRGKTYYLRFDTTMSNGAKEQVLNSHMYAGPAGGGAIGGAASSVAASLFFAGDDEKRSVKESFDKRALKKVINPGFLFVKENLALGEIKETKLFNVPEYDNNPCKPIQRKKRQPVTNSI